MLTKRAEFLNTALADRTGAAYGWNLATPIGIQFNLVNFFGFFVEGAWTMHKTYGKLNEPDSGPDSYEFMWMEVAVGAGLSFIL